MFSCDYLADDENSRRSSTIAHKQHFVALALCRIVIKVRWNVKEGKKKSKINNYFLFFQ